MMRKWLALASILAVTVSFAGSAAVQYSTPPATPEELEAAYTVAIEQRAALILEALALEDSAKAAAVHDAIVTQYRALRARDAVIQAYLTAQGKDPSEDSADRAPLFRRMSEPLHEMYVSTLAAYLTREQVETVKDKMTYGKVQVTFDVYCEMIPDLTEADKAEILRVLKAAREVAMDGGSAGEKHAIFETYKVKIHDYLNGQGHDVARAFEEWEAKQAVTEEAKAE